MMTAELEDVARRLEATRRVLDEVGIERLRHVEHYGWDDEHDERHTVGAWAWLLGRRASDLAGVDHGAINKVEARRLLVEIAAVAVAAIEATDRTA